MRLVAGLLILLKFEQLSTLLRPPRILRTAFFANYRVPCFDALPDVLYLFPLFQASRNLDAPPLYNPNIEYTCPPPTLNATADCGSHHDESTRYALQPLSCQLALGIGGSAPAGQRLRCGFCGDQRPQVTFATCLRTRKARKGTSVPIDTNWVMCIVREDPMVGGYKGGGGQDGAQSYSTSLLVAR